MPDKICIARQQVLNFCRIRARDGALKELPVANGESATCVHFVEACDHQSFLYLLFIHISAHLV